MFTIKSTSSEGVYYLVNGWQKHMALWVSPEKVRRSMLFTAPRFAKASLAKLLKVMPDYASDTFELVELSPAD